MKHKFFSIYFLLFLSFLTTYGQNWKYEKSISFENPITSQSIDPEGRIYIGTSTGAILRYNSDGTPSEIYSEINNFPVTTINAWNKFKVFIYNNSSQEFFFLNRFNTTPQTFKVDAFTQELISNSTPGVDNSIWMLSTNYNELKKFNIQTRLELLSNPLNISLGEQTYMCAFQNYLIIVDSLSGIHVFDQFGNFQFSIEDLNVRYFQVENSNLTYLKDSEIVIRNLEWPSFSQKIKAPDGSFNRLIKHENRYFMIGDRRIDIYSLVP